MKEKLLNQVNDLKVAIESEDIPMLMQLIGDIKVDTRYSSALVEYTRNLLVVFIKEYIEWKGLDALKLKVKGIYGGVTTDYYTVVNGELKRNIHPTRWDSIWDLFEVYKYINNN